MKKSCKLGFIEYRLPTLREGAKLISLYNQTNLAQGPLYVIADILEELSVLFTKVDIKFKGKSITTFEELDKVCSPVLLGLVTEVANDIITNILDDGEEEDDSEKPSKKKV